MSCARPLASIRAIGEVTLDKAEEPETYREAISSILEETNRLNETVDSLLLLARAEATETRSENEVFAIGELVNEVLALFEVLIDERHVTIMRGTLEKGQARVRADRGLLRVALLNVLHNALKFSPAGSVLKIDYEYSDAEPKTIRVIVEDQGPGIAPADRERVFERFFRGSTQPLATTNGTGLGLPIARLVVERAGGTIEFKEKELPGARCVIELPCLSQ